MLEEIKNYAAGLDATDRLLFAHELRKLAAGLEGAPQGGGMAARARATAAELRVSQEKTAKVIGRLDGLIAELAAQSAIDDALSGK